MGSISRDDQECLIYIEKGDPSNSTLELDKVKEVTQKRGTFSSLLRKIHGIATYPPKSWS